MGVKNLSRGWGLFKTFFLALRRGEAEMADYTKLGLKCKNREKCAIKGRVPDFFADSKIFDRRDAEQKFLFLPVRARRQPVVRADSKLKH